MGVEVGGSTWRFIGPQTEVAWRVQGSGFRVTRRFSGAVSMVAIAAGGYISHLPKKQGLYRGFGGLLKGSCFELLAFRTEEKLVAATVWLPLQYNHKHNNETYILRPPTAPLQGLSPLCCGWGGVLLRSWEGGLSILVAFQE